jgi:hypothetical protein
MDRKRLSDIYHPWYRSKLSLSLPYDMRQADEMRVSLSPTHAGIVFDGQTFA